LIKTVCKLGRPLIEHEQCKYFDDCVYAQLFGEEFGKASKVFFRYSYPLHLACNGVFQPTIKTLHRCSNPQCRKIFDEFVAPSECDVKDCDGSIKPVGGFRCDSCGKLEPMPVRISRITSTAIDREKRSVAKVGGVSEEVGGTLHTLEVIERGSRFRFEVLVHRDFGDAVSLLKNVLERALPDEGIGGTKSRGLGKVAVEKLKVESVSTEVLERRADELVVQRFKVQLVSPMIMDRHTLESSNFASKFVSVLLEGIRRAYSWAFRAGKPALPEIALKRWAVSGELFSGWSLKTRKRRKIVSAVSSGSVFEFECGVDSRELSLGLAALEFHAVGAYKPHGCGQIIVKKA
jgi:CRISPR/Cas system CSM-associated protein Csm3 (group 7 of RAMP superfamily)